MTGRYSRRSFVAAFALPIVSVRTGAMARQARVPRIGLLTGAEPSLVVAFRDELRALGYVDGENVIVEMRLQQPNTSELPAQAEELARLPLDVIVAGALPHALEMRKHNQTMPMVIATCPGMISNGFAKSLERPGGTVTGMDELPPGVTTKRLTLLSTAAPGVKRIALLSTTPGRGGHETQLAEAEQAAASLRVSVKPYRATSRAELDAALAAIASDGMQGLANFQGGLSIANRQLIVDFAATQRLPAIYQATMLAEAGGLMAWAPNLEEQFKMAAGYVDRILKGARPGDLPIRHPSRYFLTINTRTAAALGLTLPPALLAQADRVLS